MAEFTEVMKQKQRMCNDMCNDGGCNKKCPLYAISNGGNCNRYLSNYPQEAEEIIMNWAKENPSITNADKFKEVFGVEHIGPGCNGIKYECNSICDMCNFKNFWDEEYKEPSEV